MKEMYDLRDIFRVIKSHFRFILLSCAGGLFIGLMLSVFMIAPRYSSGVSMYVNNLPPLDYANALNINDINASQKLVNTCIVILKDDEIMSQAAVKLSEKYSYAALNPYFGPREFDENGIVKPGALRSRIKMNAVNDTEVLRIEATTESPVLSAVLCSIFSELAPNVLGRVIKAGSVELIGSAKVQNKPVFPSIPVFAVSGLVLGGMISVCIVLVTSALDNTIKGAEDIVSRYRIPVLGEIPDFSLDREEGLDPYGD